MQSVPFSTNGSAHLELRYPGEGLPQLPAVEVFRKRDQLEQCRKKRMIRARAVNGQMMYDTYELLALTELFYRRKLRKTLSRIPQFTVR